MNVEHYADEKNEETLRLYELALTTKRITNQQYQNLLSELPFTGSTDEEAFDHYQEAIQRLLDEIEAHLIERMTAGAMVIENTEDEAKKRKCMQLYNALEQELNSIRSDGYGPIDYGTGETGEESAPNSVAS